MDFNLSHSLHVDVICLAAAAAGANVVRPVRRLRVGRSLELFRISPNGSTRYQQLTRSDQEKCRDVPNTNA